MKFKRSKENKCASNLLWKCVQSIVKPSKTRIADTQWTYGTFFCAQSKCIYERSKAIPMRDLWDKRILLYTFFVIDAKNVLCSTIHFMLFSSNCFGTMIAWFHACAVCPEVFSYLFGWPNGLLGSFSFSLPLRKFSFEKVLLEANHLNYVYYFSLEVISGSFCIYSQYCKHPLRPSIKTVTPYSGTLALQSHCPEPWVQKGHRL